MPRELDFLQHDISGERQDNDDVVSISLGLRVGSYLSCTRHLAFDVAAPLDITVRRAMTSESWPCYRDFGI